MKKFLVALAALAAVSLIRPIQAAEPDAAEKLGWQLGVHSYTFRDFSIEDAIKKTQGLGVKYMSVSGSVMLDGKKHTTVDLPDDEIKKLRELTDAAGLKLMNCGVVQL